MVRMNWWTPPRWLIFTLGDILGALWMRLEMPTKTDANILYVVDLDVLKQRIKEKAGCEPHVWSCPCEQKACYGHVVYARAADGIWFACTQAFTPKPQCFRIDNVEDFDELLRDTRVPAKDRLMYSLWFQLGLREAILSCAQEESS